MAAKKTTRVSPSARGEGSKPKPVAKKVSPSKRGEGSTNTKGIVTMKKKTAKVQEAGVANVAGTVVKGAIALSKKLSSKTPKAKAAETQKNNAKALRDAEIQMRATKAKVEKELAAIAKKRAAIEKMGAEAPKRGKPVTKPQNASDYSKRKTRSEPYTDRFGNTGWR